MNKQKKTTRYAYNGKNPPKGLSTADLTEAYDAAQGIAALSPEQADAKAAMSKARRQRRRRPVRRRG